MKNINKILTMERPLIPSREFNLIILPNFLEGEEHLIWVI
jgi:hypothetical protein